MEGIEDESVIPPGQLAAYNQSVNALITALEAADGVITVSKNLESLLRELCSGVGQINVVPCGVSALHDFSSRNSTRLLLGVSENRLVASGECVYWFDVRTGELVGRYPEPFKAAPGFARPSPPWERQCQEQ